MLTMNTIGQHGGTITDSQNYGNVGSVVTGRDGTPFQPNRLTVEVAGDWTASDNIT